VIGSIFAAPDPRKTGEMADEIANTEYVDMLEINVSCPMPASAVGMHMAETLPPFSSRWLLYAKRRLSR